MIRAIVGAVYRLDVRGLSFEAGGKRILENVSLSVESGQLVAVLGPSGSGKSTLLLAMNGFRPGKGKVELCGRDLYKELGALKTRIGFVPQDDVVHLGLTVESSLTYSARLRLPEATEEERRARVTEVIDAVELSERRRVRVRKLSGGQRKRVSVAAELLASPPLLFLDEPTSGLDPALEERTMALFRRITSGERLTVVTTHVLASLDLVDLVLIMSAGRLVFCGPPREAIGHFGVADYPSIYRVLGDAKALEEKFRSSSYYTTYVRAPLDSPAPSLPPRTLSTPALEAQKPPPAAEPAPKPVVPKPSVEEELARLKANKGKK